MQINWKKTTVITLDILLAGYLGAAFTIFNKPDLSKDTCKGVTITIQDEQTNGFITTKEIKERLKHLKLYPLGKKLTDINGRLIEETLKKSPFVKTAECYKTQNGLVRISVTQRLPIIRIKANNGDDYYIDDKNSIMPNSHYTSDLIIATGSISKTFAKNQLANLGRELSGNDLWKNLIEQIHVLPDRGIELVPRIGDHIIYIGKIPYKRNKKEQQEATSKFIKLKMTRLEKFYKYGLSQAGWNKYSYINLEFDNQIICTKKKKQN